MVQKECTLHWSLILSTNYGLLKCPLNMTFHLEVVGCSVASLILRILAQVNTEKHQLIHMESYKIPNPVAVAMWINRHELCSESKLSRYGLPLMEWTLSQMWLAAPRTFVPWLYQYVLKTESCYRSQGDIGNIQSTFQHHGHQSVGLKVLIRYQLDFMFSEVNKVCCCLQ